LSSQVDLNERVLAFILNDVRDYIRAEGARNFLKDLKSFHPELYDELETEMMTLRLDKKVGILLRNPFNADSE